MQSRFFTSVDAPVPGAGRFAALKLRLQEPTHSSSTVVNKPIEATPKSSSFFKCPGQAAPPTLPHESKQTREEQDLCSICLSKISEVTLIDGCQHHYCWTCINHWGRVNPKCPQCKADFCIAQSLEDASKLQHFEPRIDDSDAEADASDDDGDDNDGDDGDGDGDGVDIDIDIDGDDDEDCYELDDFVVRDDDVEYEHGTALDALDGLEAGIGELSDSEEEEEEGREKERDGNGRRRDGSRRKRKRRRGDEAAPTAADEDDTTNTLNPSPLLFDAFVFNQQ